MNISLSELIQVGIFCVELIELLYKIYKDQEET